MSIGDLRAELVSISALVSLGAMALSQSFGSQGSL